MLNRKSNIKVPLLDDLMKIISHQYHIHLPLFRKDSSISASYRNPPKQVLRCHHQIHPSQGGAGGGYPSKVLHFIIGKNKWRLELWFSNFCSRPINRETFITSVLDTQTIMCHHRIYIFNTLILLERIVCGSWAKSTSTGVVAAPKHLGNPRSEGRLSEP